MWWQGKGLKLHPSRINPGCLSLFLMCPSLVLSQSRKVDPGQFCLCSSPLLLTSFRPKGSVSPPPLSTKEGRSEEYIKQKRAKPLCFLCTISTLQVTRRNSQTAGLRHRLRKGRSHHYLVSIIHGFDLARASEMKHHVSP